jgi:FkbM family methyltransferase
VIPNAIVAATRLTHGTVLDPVPSHPKDSVPADAKNRAVHKDGFFSQEHQDKWMLDNVFHWAKDGVFFEAGGRDGIDYSNTYFMEKHLGWTGLVVDANPVLSAQLHANRDCVTRATCLSDKEGDEITFLAYNSGIAGIEGSVEADRVKDQLKQRGIDIDSVRTRMQCHTLTKLFEDASIDTVDFFSLDIEGHELKALKGLDLNRICVYSMLIENNHGDKTIENYLAGFGYTKVAHLYIDDLYIRKEPCPEHSDAPAIKAFASKPKTSKFTRTFFRSKMPKRSKDPVALTGAGTKQCSVPVHVFFDGSLNDIGLQYKDNSVCSAWCIKTSSPQKATLLVSQTSVPPVKSDASRQYTVAWTREAYDRSPIRNGFVQYDWLMSPSVYSNIPITSNPHSLPKELTYGYPARILPGQDPRVFSTWLNHIMNLPIPTAASIESKHQKGNVAVWISSRCRTSVTTDAATTAIWHRTEYVRELRKLMPSLHARGKCLHDKKRDPPLAPERTSTGTNNYMMTNWETYADYLFVLGLENSFAEGYHTEKLSDALVSNSLLVYVGHESVADYLPKSADGHPSFIDATKFESPAALVAHLQHLATHPAEYQAYFSWRTNPEPSATLEHTEATSASSDKNHLSMCRLCACSCNDTCRNKRLHSSTKTMVSS